MKRALELTFQNAARRELCRSVRAAVEKHAGMALRVTPDNQALAETIDCHRASSRHLLRELDGIPVVPEPALKPCRNIRCYLSDVYGGHACSLLLQASLSPGLLLGKANGWPPAWLLSIFEQNELR